MTGRLLEAPAGDADEAPGGTPAARASAGPFFNAYLHETDRGRHEETPAGPAFVVDLDEGRRLEVPCRHRAAAGRHGVGVPCRRRDPDGTASPVPFPRAAQLALEALDEGQREHILTRVLRSHRNLQDVLEARAGDMDALFREPMGVLASETGLLVGHSVHPCPRDRSRFSLADARAYAPGYQASTPLEWLVVDQADVREHAVDGQGHREVVADVAEHDAGAAEAREAADDDEVVVPCHPYQLQHWRTHPDLAARLETPRMRVVARGDLPWHATSSLRTLYAPEAPWMPKFSMTVKLTNSLRHLHPEELPRGPHLSELLETPEGRRLRDRFPRWRILREPAVLVLLDDDGAPLDRTSLVWRENPWTDEDPHGTELLATLLQDDPRDGVPRLAKRLQATGHDHREAVLDWYDAYLETTLEPLLVAHADHGILFGAHQQNILLDLSEPGPEAMALRDCQGAVFSPLARRRWGDRIDAYEEEGALVFDRETAATLLVYYAVVNSTFNVVSSLARLDGVPEEALLERTRRLLRDLLDQGLADDTAVRHLLESPRLQIKGNLHYGLAARDETTQDQDVLDLYQPIDNPLQEDP